MSYSRSDGDLLTIFEDNLGVLEGDGLILPWSDRLIDASTDWDEAIQGKLADADIIVLLVSTRFLRSRYVRGVEMGEAVLRRESEEAEIVSVILEKDCSWNEERKIYLRRLNKSVSINLAKYQVVLPGIAAVREAPRPNDAFNLVEKELRKLIAKIQKRRKYDGL